MGRLILAREPESGSTPSGDADRRAGTACSPTLTAAVPPAACGRERGEGLTRIVPFEMLTEQQLAALRSEPGSNRVAKAMALAGVTQTDPGEGAPPDAALRQRCRPCAIPHHYRRRTPGSSPPTSVAVSRTCSRHPADRRIESRTDPRGGRAPGRHESRDADPGLYRRDRPRAPSQVFDR